VARNPYDHVWRAVRLRILQRDGHQCQIRLAGCTHDATQVDHITPLDQGGPRLDPSNLRAACTHCNCSLGGEMTQAAARPAREPTSRPWR
jgi:5-methylcytosine-specific restriction endonuclease McrA